MKLKDKKKEILAVTQGKDPEGFTIDTLTPIAPPLWETVTIFVCEA